MRYNDNIYPEHRAAVRTIPHIQDKVEGFCKWNVAGKPCGVKFTGTRRQKYCPIHSAYKRQTGK